MSEPLLVLLLSECIIFAIWSVLAFRWLFALKGDVADISGHRFPRMSVQLKAFRSGLTDRRYSRIRLWLSLTTIILVALSALFPFLLK